jgi:hypothetical protein
MPSDGISEKGFQEVLRGRTGLFLLSLLLFIATVKWVILLLLLGPL